MLYFLMHYAQWMYTANDRKLAGHFFSVKNNTKHSAYSIYCDFISHTRPFFFSDEWSMCPADIKPLAQS